MNERRIDSPKECPAASTECRQTNRNAPGQSPIATLGTYFLHAVVTMQFAVTVRWASETITTISETGRQSFTRLATPNYSNVATLRVSQA